MAERPVFIPVEQGGLLVREVSFAFAWHPGFAPSQKKKNLAALHEAAAAEGYSPLLEVSSKSDQELGELLSAFNLKLEAGAVETSVESAFQASKVFERGGPFDDLILAGSREAKRDPRLKASGRLIGFRFQGQDYPLSPRTVFYDWLYLNALRRREDWLAQLEGFAGFTDIEFNPKRSLNCQARSCATALALRKRGIFEDALASFEAFWSRLQASEV